MSLWRDVNGIDDNTAQTLLTIVRREARRNLADHPVQYIFWSFDRSMLLSSQSMNDVEGEKEIVEVWVKYDAPAYDAMAAMSTMYAEYGMDVLSVMASDANGIFRVMLTENP